MHYAQSVSYTHLSYEKEDEKKESEQNYVSVNESIEMDVETQGIPTVSYTHLKTS